MELSGGTGDMPITLIVKAPNQRVADQNVECTLSWTIRKLKEHLQHVYPSKPKHNQQKLIYSGKLLEDNLTLKQVLRQSDETSNHTVHLVCSMSADSCNVDDGQTPSKEKTTPVTQKASKPQSSSESTPSNEGLRYRGSTHPQSNTASSHQPSPSPTQPNLFHNMSQMYTGMPQMYGQAPSMYGQMPQMYGQVPQMYGQMPQMYGQMPQMYGQMPAGYNQEQYNMMVQQMYAQYMSQYMQYFQQSTMTPPPSPATPVTPEQPANGNPANNNANRPANQNIRMNAQGGIVEDDEEDNEHRDWLDCVYILFRFLVLLSIVYFYSTFTRSLAVFMVFFLIYLLQKGWLLLRRGNRNAQPEQQPVNQNANPAPNEPTETQENNTENNEETLQTDESNDGSQQGETETPTPQPAATGILATAWCFITTFFSSLIPEQPVAVNQN